jgi:hypothetical protein
MNLIRPYIKVVDLVNQYACVAIYEPNPFRPEAICEAVKQVNKKSSKIEIINIGDPLDDESWCWVYYDWCGNPVGLGRDTPEGRLTYKLMPKDFEWMGYDNAVRYCEYLNREPNKEMIEEWENKYGNI